MAPAEQGPGNQTQYRHGKALTVPIAYKRPVYLGGLSERTFTVRLADSDSEIATAQTLRHRIFLGEPSQSTNDNDRDHDPLDNHCDHLIVLDQQAGERIVGVCRLIRRNAAEQAEVFTVLGHMI